MRAGFTGLGPTGAGMAARRLRDRFRTLLTQGGATRYGSASAGRAVCDAGAPSGSAAGV